LVGTLLLIVASLASSAQGQITTELFAATLDNPTYLTAPPGDTDRVFVTERFGDIEILDADTGAAVGTFLSLTGTGILGEGLQGLAFHPDYANNGYFYVYYTVSGGSRLVRYSVSGDPNVADPLSADTVLELVQPAPDHNGGWIGFGPDDYLYFPTGDGGGANDPSNYGQNVVGELYGSVLRLDVDADDFPGDPDRNYAIASGNPFVGEAGEDEIWAYGLRNPFRSSFDRLTGDFYIGDVGQAAMEETDFQPASSLGKENYGWRLREGTIATPTGGVGGPQPADGVDPIYDYPHGSGDEEGFSITGGYVYRGNIAAIQGKYFFADFVTERIWSIEHDGTSVTLFEDWTQELDPPGTTIDQIVGFGEDAAANLYIVDLGGQIFRVIESTNVPSLGPQQLAWLVGGITLGGALALRRRAAARR
jgi:hypothetical protein